MIKIIWAILILAALGIIFGLGLSLASKYLYVKEDERIDEVAKLLPNANCGACGYPGCRGLAEAIVKGEEHKISKCKPGKPDKNFTPIINYLNEHPNEDGTKLDVKM
ncbi:MAG: RnfABCDGE type electron transport complex subunit B [Bacillales bacterium]|nr:RnfABCDGE type electron transport complex subunit B [Bacillales bacterium]MDY6003250.1 RnfABCDGE type electron transport complex subunit B [Bacilli bacterium]